MTEQPKLMEIAPENFQCGAFRAWGMDWLALAAGDFAAGKFNAMTVGWGFLGTMWSMPAAMVVVRPQRYTMEFLDRYPNFTLCAFPPEFKPALTHIGKVSGRECPDKIAQAGLTPCAAAKVSAPAFREAELMIECRQCYRGEFAADRFLDKSLIDRMYPQRDFHICLIGEVLRVAGTAKYSK